VGDVGETNSPNARADKELRTKYSFPPETFPFRVKSGGRRWTDRG
jgi:hypothetical protein